MKRLRHQLLSSARLSKNHYIQVAEGGILDAPQKPCYLLVFADDS